MKETLEEMGLEITLDSSIGPDQSNFDLVHCFNILRVSSIKESCIKVFNSKKPLIITPIYWNMVEFIKKHKPELIKKWQQEQVIRKKILVMADLIAPNAYLEWIKIKEDLGVDKPYRVIFNGVDSCFARGRYNNQRNGVLMVGRIHTRKNQLGLIKAMKNTGIILTLIGDVNDPNYYKECAAVGGNNVKILRGVDQRTLIKYYNKAKVHALPSWYDTPGLVSLEAGLAGCNIVTTSRGTAQEYFKDLAFYCNPDKEADIKEKVVAAYQKECNNLLSNYIQENYLWSKVGEKTRQIYIELLSSNI